MWYPIHAINLNLLQVKGRSDLFLRLEIIKKILGVTVLCITAPVWSYCDVLWFNSQFARSISDKHLLHRQTDQCRFFQTMCDLLPTIVLCLVMFVLILMVNYFIPSDIVKLCVGVAIGMTFYIIVKSHL